MGEPFFMEISSEENLPGLRQKYRETFFLLLAQAISVVLLIGIAWFLTPRLDLAITEQTTTALWGLIIFIAIGVFILRRVLFRWERLNRAALQNGTQGLISALQINTIILGILAELIAITGFLISVMTGNKFEMFRAGAVSLIVFLVIMPRKRIWEKIIGNIRIKSI